MPTPLLGFFAGSSTCFVGRGKSGGPLEFLRPESDAKMDLLPAPPHIKADSFSPSVVIVRTSQAQQQLITQLQYLQHPMSALTNRAESQSTD